jgi:hypothetical protein
MVTAVTVIMVAVMVMVLVTAAVMVMVTAADIVTILVVVLIAQVIRDATIKLHLVHQIPHLAHQTNNHFVRRKGI